METKQDNYKNSGIITDFSKPSEIRRRIVIQCKVSQREFEHIKQQIPAGRTLSELIRQRLGIAKWWNNDK